MSFNPQLVDDIVAKAIGTNDIVWVTLEEYRNLADAAVSDYRAELTCKDTVRINGFLVRIINEKHGQWLLRKMSEKRTV